MLIVVFGHLCGVLGYPPVLFVRAIRKRSLCGLSRSNGWARAAISYPYIIVPLVFPPCRQLLGASGVISCVGGFGSNEQMEKICGDATVVATEAAEEVTVGVECRLVMFVL